MESYLFKADVNFGFRIAGGVTFSTPKAIIVAADRLITRMHRGSIKSVVVKQKVFS